MQLDVKYERPQNGKINEIEVPYYIFDVVADNVDLYDNGISLSENEYIEVLVEVIEDIFSKDPYFIHVDFTDQLTNFLNGYPDSVKPSYRELFDAKIPLKTELELNLESAPPLTAKTVMGSAPDKIEISSEMEM